MASERLSAHDATFLYAETATTSMNVGAVFLLAASSDGGEELTVATLRDTIRQRIHLVPRLRQRLLMVPLHAGFPVWADDPDFSVDDHVKPAPLTPSSSWQEVRYLMARLQGQPLPRERPLWDLFLAEQTADGTAVLLLRAHHAVVDGMSGIRLVQALFGRRQTTAPPWTPATLPTRRSLLRKALTDRRQPAATSDPDAPRLPRLPPARRGQFNVTVGRDRTLVTFDLPSSQARAIASRLGGTTQDVALTIVAGALARFPTGKRRAKALRTVVPVAEAVPNRQLQLGNHAAFFLVDLPVAALAEDIRFETIRQATAAAREAGQSQAIARWIRAGERVPAAVYAVAVPLLARVSSANLVVTFMRGPRSPLAIGGMTLQAAYASLPLGRRLALLAGVLDMGGTMGFSFTADPRAVPDVELLAENCAVVVRELS